MRNATTIARGFMLIVGLGLVFAGTASAQTARFDIPFSFVAGRTVLPAGQYDVKMDVSARRMYVVPADGTAQTTLAAIPNEANETPAASRLAFRKRGSTYVMSGAWLSDRHAGLELPADQVARALARAAGEPVTVAQVESARPRATSANIIFGARK
jgi:hypothetical protein